MDEGAGLIRFSTDLKVLQLRGVTACRVRIALVPWLAEDPSGSASLANLVGKPAEETNPCVQMRCGGRCVS